MTLYVPPRLWIFVPSFTDAGSDESGIFFIFPFSSSQTAYLLYTAQGIESERYSSCIPTFQKKHRLAWTVLLALQKPMEKSMSDLKIEHKIRGMWHRPTPRIPPDDCVTR
jgi:hypothetical protein